jgi:hypothetical protein
MGDTYLKQQALATPGAVAGDGGFVYRPDDAGSAITVLYDPEQAATGVTLTEGPEFEAVRGELVRRGVMPPAEFPAGGPDAMPDVPPSRRHLLARDQDLIESEQLAADQGPPMPDEREMATRALEGQPRGLEPQVDEGRFMDKASPYPNDWKEKPSEPFADRARAITGGADVAVRGVKEEAGVDESRSLSDRLAGIERALALITGQQEN